MAQNGVRDRSRFRLAVTGSRPPQDTPARAARGTTDARKTPSARAGVLAREKEPRATRQVHCGRVIESDEGKTTETLNFLNFEQQQCMQGVRQNEFGLWEFFLELKIGGVASHCSSRLQDFWWNFWRSVHMNFIKFGKSGPNLQQV